MDERLSNCDTAPTSAGIFFVLLLLALVFRVPWFFQDVITWDESVFIVVGDAWASGHLPYTLVWDNKPPLGFAFFALVISILPDSLAFIRFSGAVLVAAAGLLVFIVSSRIMPRYPAWLSSALFVVAVSVLISNGMAVMMEHVALVPMLGALVLTGRQQASPATVSTIGALLGLAAMIRPNLAYVLLAVTLLFPLTQVHQNMRHYIMSASFIALGGCAVIGGTFALYLLHGQGELFLNSVVRVPLAYSQSGIGIAAAAEELLRQALRLDGQESLIHPRRVLSSVFWIAGFLGILGLLFSTRRWTTQKSLPIVFLAATLMSMVSSGFIWSHHLIQVAPFFAFGAGLSASRIRLLQSRIIVILIISALAIGFTFSRRTFYSELWESYANRKPFYHGETFEIARHLKNFMTPQDTLFVTNDILLYWLTDTYPPIPVAGFPFNLWEEKTILKPLYGPSMTTDVAFEEIAATEPTWIVLPVPGSRSRIGGDPRRIAPKELLQNYYLQHSVSDRNIYRRK